MSIRFEPVTLDSVQDGDALLVFRDDRLTAVVAKLGEIHDEHVGEWFVEVTFSDMLRPRATPFHTLAEVEMWIGAAPGR